MQINEDVGNEYKEVLEEVVRVRSQRKKLYGDSYSEMDSLGHAYHAQNKIKRLMFNIKSGNKNYESAKDNALDIINYMLFFLIMLEKEKRTGAKQ